MYGLFLVFLRKKLKLPVNQAYKVERNFVLPKDVVFLVLVVYGVVAVFLAFYFFP